MCKKKPGYTKMNPQGATKAKLTHAKTIDFILITTIILCVYLFVLLLDYSDINIMSYGIGYVYDDG